MPLIGYARVSMVDQSLSLQLDALHEVGCETVFDDHASGVRPTGLGWLRRSPTYVAAMRSWSGSWTGSAVRWRTLSKRSAGWRPKASAFGRSPKVSIP